MTGRQLDLADIEALATGAWILGAGGGGSPYHGLLNMRRLHKEGRRVSLVPPGELADDDLVAPVSMVGAPLVFHERLTDSRVIARAVALMGEYAHRKIRGVMPIEIGGGNSFQPLLAAAELGLELIDADAMGRAFPEAQMTSFAVHGLQPAPLIAVDPRDNEVVITRIADWTWLERITRKVCTEFGSMAATCKALRTGREVKTCAVLGSVSRAIALGHAVAEARRRHDDPVAAVLAAENGKLLFSGAIASVDRRATEGFLRGTASLKGVDAYASMRLDLEFQNEFSVAWLDGDPLITTPDLICVLDVESGEAIGTDSLRYGQRVALIAIQAPAIFRTDIGLSFVGPRSVGYDLSYTTVFP